MIDKTKEMKGLGFQNQSRTTNSMQFIGRESYLKELEDTMRYKVVNFPRGKNSSSHYGLHQTIDKSKGTIRYYLAFKYIFQIWNSDKVAGHLP